MDQIVKRVAERAELSRKKAERAVGVLLRVIREEGEEGLVEKLFETFEEAGELADEADALIDDELDDNLGESDDLTAAGRALAVLGVEEEDVDNLIQGFIEAIQDEFGEDDTAELIESVPALAPYA